METTDLLLSLIIIIIFVLLYLYNILGVTIEKIKQLWPLYRCNPIIMPFAGFFGHDPATNFNNCVQNIETSYMSELLKPINYNINTIRSAGDQINTSVVDTKSFINRFRNDVANIVKNIMGVFLNLTVNIEQSNVGIKDVLSRLSATLTALTYYADGNLPTINSAKSKYAKERADTAAQLAAASDARAAAADKALRDSEATSLAASNAAAKKCADSEAAIRAETIAQLQAQTRLQAQTITHTDTQANSQAQVLTSNLANATASNQAQAQVLTSNLANATAINQAQSVALARAQLAASACDANSAVCFHPNTLIKTADNKIVKIKNLKLSDRLKNGQKICATMKINNLDSSNNYIEDLYVFDVGEKNQPFLVSGSHLIYDESIMNYIHVKDHPLSVKSDINSETLVCLITSDHTIPLGNYIFHDWEDNNGSCSKDAKF